MTPVLSSVCFGQKPRNDSNVTRPARKGVGRLRVPLVLLDQVGLVDRVIGRVEPAAGRVDDAVEGDVLGDRTAVAGSSAASMAAM